MSRKPPKKQKRPVIIEDLTKADRIIEKLREIQWKTNCSTQTLKTFLNELRGELGDLIRELDNDTLPKSFKYADKKMRRMVRLFHLLA